MINSAMLYSLVITIAAAIVLVAVIAGVALLARRLSGGEGLAVFRGWRWYPSPLGLLILLPIVAFLLIRAAPLLLLIPLAIPLLWRSRRLAGPGFVLWNLWRDERERRNQDEDDPPGDGDTWPYRN